MKTINLNYATSRYQYAVLYVWFGSSLLCLVVLLGVYLQLVSQVSAINAGVAQLKSPQQNDMTSVGTHKVDPNEVLNVQLAMQELSTPWEPLFEALEALNDSGVRLISVEPEVKQHQLKLTAEANDVKQMLDYVSALTHEANVRRFGKNGSQAATLENVLLVSQTQTTGTSGQPILSFVVEAKWRF